MTAREMVEYEVARLDAILARRGQFFEDEHAERSAFGRVLAWMNDERAEVERIEIAAAEAEEAAEEAARLADPNRKTKELFSTYRNKLKQEGKMR